VGISHQQIQKKIHNPTKYSISKNKVNKKEFKNKNTSNPSFKVIYLIFLYYKNISISKLIDSILNKLIIVSTV
jgi:hypothetical protein